MRQLSLPTAPPMRPRGGAARPRLWTTLWRQRRLLLRGGLLATAIIAPLGLWQLGTFGRLAQATRDAMVRVSAAGGFVVDEILVTGRQATRQADILAALDVRRGTPMLTVDPSAAKARLERLAWVRQATVERRFPSHLFVRLQEREPLALWQNGGAFHLVDRDGAVIPRVDPARYPHLPHVVGPDAPRHTAALLQVVATEPELQVHVIAASHVGQRRWDLRLDNGVTVRLPAADPGQAWARLAHLQRQYAILERDLATIDLRLPDRLVVKLAPGAFERSPAKTGKNT